MRQQRIKGNLPALYQTKDISAIPANWRKEFDKEVADGNFIAGEGQCVFLRGEGAEAAARLWIRALTLGRFAAYRTTPLEMSMRAAGKTIPYEYEGQRDEFEDADCVLIDGFFEKAEEAMPSDMCYHFSWVFREMLIGGVVIIVACDQEKPNMDAYSEALWEKFEQEFEVLYAADQTQAATVKRKTFGKHGGSTAAVGNPKGKVGNAASRD
jgi:hypothetical protein